MTLRLEPGLPNVRRKDLFRVVRRSVRGAGEHGRGKHFGFRVVHYSVQSNHMHLVVEAKSSDALSRGMKGLKVRMARGLNGSLGRRGRVFSDRYHAHVLRTPREVRNALAYVLLNARKHAAQRGRQLASTWVDPFSSSVWFDGWRKDCPIKLAGTDDGPDVAKPHTWLLSVGWRRHGLINTSEVPHEVGPVRKRAKRAA